MAHIPTPRLLPLTILALSGLLAMKSVTMVRAAVGGPDKTAAESASGAASAAGASASPDKPAAAAKLAASDKPATADKKPPTPPPIPPAPIPPPQMPSQPSGQNAPEPTVSDGERAVLLDLRQRRQELDGRETALAARESTLAAAELRLNARVTELETLQHQLESLEQARQQRDDVSWQGLVKTYESMKPRDAATIFNDLEMPVLLGVVDRMKDRTAAPILAAMLPDKARELTIKLAALRTKRASVAQSN
jgi:flagellar motility protein MotE (MotC chaperone)